MHNSFYRATLKQRNHQLPEYQRYTERRFPQNARIQILNATDRQAIDNQTTGAIVKREDGPLAEPPAALDL